MGGRGTDDSSQPPGMGSDRQASGTSATKEAGQHGLSATGTGETARWVNTITQDQGPEGSDPRHSSKKRGVFTPVTPALGRQRQAAVWTPRGQPPWSGEQVQGLLGGGLLLKTGGTRWVDGRHAFFWIVPSLLSGGQASL